MHHSKQENKSRGFLAQLVQSIWFTPRGSGVRIPQDPQKRKRNLSKKFGFLAQLVQSNWFTPRGSGVRIPQDPQKISQISGRFFYFIPKQFIKLLLHFSDQAQKLGTKQKVGLI